MSKFYKIILFLISIILLELIFFGNKPIIRKSSGLYEVSNYSSKKSVVIMIDLTASRMEVFQDGNVIKTYPISGGKGSTPSPIGTFMITNKDTWGEGFGGRWMGLNVPWGKYGIHGTVYPNLIGSNVSKGCIRMRSSDAAELYRMVSYGTKVIISGGPYGRFGDYLRVIKPGFRGADVYEVQRLLKEKGYFNGYVDGIYGESLRSAVHKFQKDNKIQVSDNINYTFYTKLGVELSD